MPEALQRLRSFFSAEPDQALVRARAASERLVAVVRLGIIVILILASVALVGTSRQLMGTTFGLAIGALAYGVVLLLLADRIRVDLAPWVVSTIDVTFLSITMGWYLLIDAPMGVLNNRVTFEAYFVAITISTLRFDWRICAYTALLAMAEYLGLSAYIAHQWDVASLHSDVHGEFVAAKYVNRLFILAGHGASCVAVAQWARHLRLMVGTDHLTGLLQRRPFLERIEEELRRADPERSSLSIAVFDVDEFKRFNDRFGHLAGDRALQAIGEYLRKAVRTTDLVARYGGEEFVVAFPRMDVAAAMRRADLLRLGVEALVLGPDQTSLTISGGVSSWPVDGQEFESLLSTADDRLYAAKRSGRNVVIGPAPTSLRAPANA